MDLNVVDHLLTTTRSVRKRLDMDRPVEPEIIEACLEIATQAPTGSNSQGWHFVVITDPDKRAKIAEYYKKSFYDYLNSQSDPPLLEKAEDPALPQQLIRVRNSSTYLADNMHKVPVLIIHGLASCFVLCLTSATTYLPLRLLLCCTCYCA